MKLPLSWLREWVEIPWPARELGERLTMLGFEVEGVGAAAPSSTPSRTPRRRSSGSAG
jgi:hypothetical protein